MVLAYHSIFTVRGFWLPNDQRGSWSEIVRSYELLEFGRATKTDERRSLAREPLDHQKRDEARQSLKYGTIQIDGIQARAVARGFARAVAESKYNVLACSILPDHVHAVVARFEDRTIERIVGHLKSRATQQLLTEQIHPLQQHHLSDGSVPSMWVEHGWNVFLDSEDDIGRAIEYVEQNPLKAGFKAQRWNFVQARM